MTSSAFRPVVTAAVEGHTDAAVAERLIDHAGGKIGSVYGREGKALLRRQITGYNVAARRTPWLVLVDLDADAECPVTLVRMWLPGQAAGYLCFRVAVREIESWLMADSKTLSTFLRVRPGQVPRDPERIEHPKRAMISLASRSTNRAIREDMGRDQGKGRRVGSAAYSRRLVDYVRAAWRPEVAAERSESLSRTVTCLRRLIAEYRAAVIGPATQRKRT